MRLANMMHPYVEVSPPSLQTYSPTWCVRTLDHSPLYDLDAEQKQLP
jgi:hypothetical protein